MAEVVDSIIAELIAKADGYVATFDAASAAHGRFKKSVDALKGQTFDLAAEGQKYKAGANAIAGAEENASTRIVAARKKRTDAEKEAAAAEKQAAKESAAAQKAAAKEAADAVKAAAKERADAAKQAAKAEADAAKEAQKRANDTAEAERRLAVAARESTRAQIENLERLKAAEREAANQVRANAFLTGSGNRANIKRSEVQSAFGGQLDRLEAEQVARERGPVAAPSRSIPIIGGTGNSITDAEYQAALARTKAARDAVAGPGPASRAPSASTGAAEVAAQKEVNAGKVEQIRLEDSLTYLTGERKREVQELLTEIRLSNRLEAEGVAQSEIALRLEQRRAAVAAERAAVQAKSSTNTARQALEGATLGYAPSGPAFTGIAIAAGAGITAAAVVSATNYAKALDDVSKAAGISAEKLQVYQHAAVDAGAKSTDFDTAISQLSDNLGKARTGSETQAKAFAALGINIKNAATAGDLMPTLIDRLSSISDQATRAAVETALFGESGRKLDGLLSGGNAKVNELAAALERTGSVLSSEDVAKLDEVSKKLEAVKAQLQVDVAQTVASNADAILSLAKSFAALADDIGEAVTAFDRFQKTGFGSALADPTKAGASLTGNGLIGLVRRIRGLNPDDGSDPNAPKGVTIPLDDPVQPGKVNNSLLAKLGAPKGPKGKSAEQLANEADERTKRFNDTIARYQDEQLAAVAEQTADEEKRRDLQRDQIDRDTAKQIADLRTQAGIDTRKAPSDAKLIASRLAQEEAAARAAAVEKKNVINLQSNAAAIDRDVAAQNAILQFKNEQLQAQETLAKTAADRRDLELQMLANEQQIAANSANGVLRKADQGVPTAQGDIDAANRTLKDLPAQKASQTAVIDKQTQGPFEAYVDGLPKTAKQIGEAFQGAAVNGVEALNGSLDQSISKMLRLHGAAGEFLNDLIKIGLQVAEGALLGGGQSSGGGLGGIIGSLFGGGASTSSLLASRSSAESSILGAALPGIPGFASGGGGVLGGNPGVDQNTLSLNGNPIARVGRGELLTVSPNVAASNQRVVSGQSGPVIHQTIQYAGAVDIADKGYVNQIAAAQLQATRSAIASSSSQTLSAAPARVQRTQTLGT